MTTTPDPGPPASARRRRGGRARLHRRVADPDQAGAAALDTLEVRAVAGDAGVLAEQLLPALQEGGITEPPTRIEWLELAAHHYAGVPAG